MFESMDAQTHIHTNVGSITSYIVSLRQLFKERPILNDGTSFCKRVVNICNQFLDEIVILPCLSAFKCSLKKRWSRHPFTAACHEPGPATGFTMSFDQNAPSETIDYVGKKMVR